jgi:hypothetical protein
MNHPRAGMGVAVLNGKVYVVGGVDGVVVGYLEEYDPTTNIWTERANLLTPRNQSVVFAMGGKLYAAAGGDDSQALSSVEVYDPATQTWSAAGNLPQSKGGANGAFLDGRAYVVSGNNASGQLIPDVYAAELQSLSNSDQYFTLDANGTLRTNAILDYEANATHSIRVRVTDDQNGTFEKVFAISVTDVPDDPAPEVDLTTGLRGHYPLDGDATDVSGNGNHGTVNGAGPTVDRHGNSGKALSFDGLDDYVSGGTWFNGLSDFTLSFWMKPSPSDSDGGTILQTGSGSVSLSGEIFSQVFQNRSGGPGTRHYYSSVELPPSDRWFHVVTTGVAANAMSIWIDGESFDLGGRITDGGVNGKLGS